MTGTSAFIVPKEGYRIFSVIDPEKSLLPTKYKKHLLQYFGIEDTVVNNTAISHDEKKIDSGETRDFLFKKNGFKMTNRRYFSVQCISNTEVLTLTMTDIDRMKRDYPFSTRSLFIIMMKQTKNLLQF